MEKQYWQTREFIHGAKPHQQTIQYYGLKETGGWGSHASNLHQCRGRAGFQINDHFYQKAFLGFQGFYFNLEVFFLAGLQS